MKGVPEEGRRLGPSELSLALPPAALHSAWLDPRKRPL